MIERGSGRTSGLTDWHRMDVNSMWACLQDHDTTNHWKQVAGWRKICDLAQTHLSRLREYRRGLAEAWPPATNAAARAYLAELDELIDKVRRTHDAAAANYTALAAATQAISGTRARLKTIHEEYAAKLQQKQAYEATAADPKAAMGSRVPDRPVTDADLEQLNVQARGIMYGLSSELQQAQVTLRQPPPPPKTTRQPTDPDVYASDAPPIVPGIIPVPLPNDAPPPGRLSGPGKEFAAAPASFTSGPVLGGVATSGPALSAGSGLASPTPVAPQAPVTASAAGTPTSGALPSNSAVWSSLPRTTPESNRRPAGLSRGGPATPSVGPSAQPRATPHGEVIGTTPGTTTSDPANRASQPRHVNPIGGVIGGGGAGTAPAGAAGSRPGGGRVNSGVPPVGGSPQMLPNRPNGQDSDGRHRRWDPDQPWETDRGVPPVVLPPDQEGPIDPGPAIGLTR
ncbi:hypothetical protein D7I43_07335 [Micromonospora globbae]|uniref:PPE domain-containing protein n=1 Tax=Micromonospora globbae TaxID=1894969 RepID=A0A420F5D2_9ACTN|nr:hypothetical protein [Micromonospora globbae]RKF28140.1 hypothetical protein D7I43_07335 [Micromonospora globbae]